LQQFSVTLGQKPNVLEGVMFWSNLAMVALHISVAPVAENEAEKRLALTLNRIGIGETSSTILANSARLTTHMCSVSVARFTCTGLRKWHEGVFQHAGPFLIHLTNCLINVNSMGFETAFGSKASRLVSLFST
jgi:hypothetical protein